MYCSGASRRRRVENSIKSILNKYSLTPGLHWEIKLLNISDILMWRRQRSRDKGGIADIQLIRRYAFHLQRLTAYCVLKMYVHFAQKMSRINANVVQ